MTMYPKNIGEVNNSCFIKFLTGGVMCIILPFGMSCSCCYGCCIWLLYGLIESNLHSNDDWSCPPFFRPKEYCFR